METFTNKEKRFFSVAEGMSRLSTYERNRVGCAIVYHNKIISTGCNKNLTHPLQKKYDRYRSIPDKYPHKLHAETDAIRHIIDLDIDWSKVSIYVYRKKKSGSFGIARPCKSCMKLIKDLGIRYVYYTGDESFQYEYLE